MTYAELLNLYGGNLNQPMAGEGGMAPATRSVMMPDGRILSTDGAGNLVVANRNGDSRTQTVETYDPNGGMQSAQRAYNPDQWQNSLAGALAVGVGGPLAGGAASGLLGGAPAAGGASGLFDAASLAAIDGAAPLASTGLGAGGFAAIDGAAAGAAGAGAAGGASGLLGGAGSALGGLGSAIGGYGPLLAAGLGGLAGVAGNGNLSSGSQSTGNLSSQQTGQTDMRSNAMGQTSQGLASWMQPYAQDYLARAQQLASGPTTNAALDTSRNALTGLVQNGNPLVNQAQSQQSNVIGGQMLNANPYIDQTARSITDRMGEAYATGTRAGTFGAFNNDGNSVLSKSGFGQTLGNQDRAFGDSLGSTLNSLYGQNYANERAAQDNASRASLGFGQFDANNASNLYGMGQQDYTRPFAANQAYGQAINPAFGSTGTTQNTATGQNNTNAFTNSATSGSNTMNAQGPSDWLASLGGAAGGLGMYRSIFGGR
jgi:hypothetical protein